MAKDATKKSSVPITTDVGPSLEEKIRRRAYQLYEERGREDGHDLMTGSVQKRNSPRPV